MSCERPALPGVGSAGSPRIRSPSTYRWVRRLAVVAIGFVIASAFQTQPTPGAQGAHLGVAVALICLAAATFTMIRLTAPRPALLMALLVVMVLSSAALIGFQVNGAGVLGVFPAVSAAALRLPARLSGPIAGIAVVALAVGWALGGRHTAFAISLNEFGVVAFYLVSLMARRLRESTEQAQGLIAELEETRAAQAQAAALRERQRLAREMHDVLAHSLSGLVLNLEGARLLAEGGAADSAVAAALERAHRLAKTGLEEARRAIGMLRDDALPGPDQLGALATAFERDSGVPCTLEVSGEERELGSEGRLTLYRVAQEALTNIRKHAHAERVELHLAYEANGTRLSIEDFEGDGAADGPAARVGAGDAGGRDGGYGLTGMRERAELLGGTLEAGSTGDGFRVELWVPT